MTDATGTRVLRRMIATVPIPHATPMGRAYSTHPTRARWHILNDDGAPICERQPAWNIVDLADFAGVVELRGLICNPCHRRFSWNEIPHELVVEDRGYVTPCHVFPRTQDGQGYGRRHRDGKWQRPHREVYEAIHGAIPDGLLIHHLCEQKDCFREDHLELMTRQEHGRLHMAQRQRGAGGQLL